MPVILGLGALIAIVALMASRGDAQTSSSQNEVSKDALKTYAANITSFLTKLVQKKATLADRNLAMEAANALNMPKTYQAFRSEAGLPKDEMFPGSTVSMYDYGKRILEQYKLSSSWQR